MYTKEEKKIKIYPPFIIYNTIKYLGKSKQATPTKNIENSF